MAAQAVGTGDELAHGIVLVGELALQRIRALPQHLRLADDLPQRVIRKTQVGAGVHS